MSEEASEAAEPAALTPGITPTAEPQTEDALDEAVTATPTQESAEKASLSIATLRSTTSGGSSTPGITSLLLGIIAWARRVETDSAAETSTSNAAYAVTTAQTTTGAAPSVDATEYLQAKFDALQPGETLTLDPGVYKHSGNLYIRVPNVTIDGSGATLQATNPATSAVGILADNVTFTNVNIVQDIGLARNDNAYRAGLVVGNSGVTVGNIAVTGGSSVGVFVIGASNFLLDGIDVKDVASDGIKLYAGANNGVVHHATVERTGDDGISVVSYRGDPISHDIQIIAPVVHRSEKTRGLVVSGGANITFTDITVVDTALSGVFVGSQKGVLPTQSSTNIVVDGRHDHGREHLDRLRDRRHHRLQRQLARQGQRRPDQGPDHHRRLASRVEPPASEQWWRRNQKCPLLGYLRRR